MSVVVCKITENGYEIAADSISIRGYTQSKGGNTNRSKLIEVNDMVLGSVGTAEESSLLQLYAMTNRPRYADEGSILEYLSEFSDWKNKKSGNAKITNSYMLGFQDKVFFIQHWLIQEVVTYEAIGAGMNFALAALYLGHSAEKAIETAIELSVYCEGPVQIIRRDTTKKNES